MSGHELASKSAVQLLAGYRSRSFTPSEVVEDVIKALEETDTLCSVMVTPMFDSARAAARTATEAWRRGGDPVGPLAGIPVTVKDLIFVAGVPAHGGAPSVQPFVPSADAAVVTSLREAGAILTCKTTTCESGYKLTADSPVSGVTRNPWCTDRTSGGSSGGAAAAVAAGCGPLALGTDGVGSIRVPSSFCGVVGLKPTFGRVPAGARLLSALLGIACAHRPDRPERAGRGAAPGRDRPTRSAGRGQPAGAR